MADAELDKNQAATPFKLEEAKKRGSVPKSVDVGPLLALSAGVAVIHFSGPSIASNQINIGRAILALGLANGLTADQSGRWLTSLLYQMLATLSPLFIVLATLAVLGSLAQTGPVFSFFPLKPDINRINPVAGFKRIYSIRMLIEAAKSIFKFIAIGWVMANTIIAAMPDMMQTLAMHPKNIGHVLWPLIDRLLIALLLVVAAIAVLDFSYSRWDYFRRLMMSRREVKDEFKRREGDPRIKNRLRELQREVLKRAKSLSRIQDADVLVTNPTRLAVAIQYDPSKIDAPVVIAKGAGFLAARMRSLAVLHGIPIVENKPLARSLFHKVGLERAVSEEYFGVLARIMLWAQTLKKSSSSIQKEKLIRS
jgi:flagellar biosynthetic protein FlhB